MIYYSKNNSIGISRAHYLLQKMHQTSASHRLNKVLTTKVSKPSDSEIPHLTEEHHLQKPPLILLSEKMFLSTSPSGLQPCAIVCKKKKVSGGQGPTLSLNSAQELPHGSYCTIKGLHSLLFPSIIPEIFKLSRPLNANIFSRLSILFHQAAYACPYYHVSVLSWLPYLELTFTEKYKSFIIFFQNNFGWYETFEILYIFYFLVWFLRPDYTIYPRLALSHI